MATEKYFSPYTTFNGLHNFSMGKSPLLPRKLMPDWRRWKGIWREKIYNFTTSRHTNTQRDRKEWRWRNNFSTQSRASSFSLPPSFSRYPTNVLCSQNCLGHTCCLWHTQKKRENIVDKDSCIGERVADNIYLIIIQGCKTRKIRNNGFERTKKKP